MHRTEDFIQIDSDSVPHPHRQPENLASSQTSAPQQDAQSGKRPFISMRDLNIPNNRISENGLLIPPDSLVEYFNMMNTFFYNRNDLSLLEGFQHRNAFKMKICSVDPDGTFETIPFEENEACIED